MTTTRTFDLQPGKWRVNTSLAGYKVVAVGLEGLRGRPYPLREVAAEEFFERVPKDPVTGVPPEEAVFLRGTPTFYYYHGANIHLYPAPLHAWRLVVTYEPRDPHPNDRPTNALGQFMPAVTDRP